MKEYDVRNIEERAIKAIFLLKSSPKPGSAEDHFIRIAKDDVPKLCLYLRQVRDLLPDPLTLRLLADWLEFNYPKKGFPEIAWDLRRHAQQIKEFHDPDSVLRRKKKKTPPPVRMLGG